MTGSVIFFSYFVGVVVFLFQKIIYNENINKYFKNTFSSMRIFI